MSLLAFITDCGYCELVVTVQPDGTADGHTDPEGEVFDNQAIQACFQAAGVTPEPGTYTFHVYKHGTQLVTAPSQNACDQAAKLEVAVDAHISQPLIARLQGAQQSTLPSDSGLGMHGEGMHGIPADV